MVAKALAKARLCGRVAAEARRVATLVSPPRRAAADPISPELETLGAMMKAGTAEMKAILADLPKPATTQAEITRAALERLKAAGGRRARS